MKIRVQLVEDIDANVDTVLDSFETDNLEKDAAEELLAAIGIFLEAECKIHIFEVD
jgi:hypothetical protein